MQIGKSSREGSASDSGNYSGGESLHHREQGAHLICCNRSWIHSRLQLASLWNHSKRRCFLLHPAAVLNIHGAASPRLVRFS